MLMVDAAKALKVNELENFLSHYLLILTHDNHHLTNEVVSESVGSVKNSMEITLGNALLLVQGMVNAINMGIWSVY